MGLKITATALCAHPHPCHCLAFVARAVVRVSSTVSTLVVYTGHSVVCMVRGAESPQGLNNAVSRLLQNVRR
ncbi:MAG: hypothetical protein ACI8PT_000188 [Gammaproteobacteria bacterium]|jgi:hypothetical protein